MTVPVAGGDGAGGDAPGCATRRPSRSGVVARRPARRVLLRSTAARGSSLWVAPAGGGESVARRAHVMPKRVAFTPDGRALCWSGTGPAVNVGIWCVAARPGARRREPSRCSRAWRDVRVSRSPATARLPMRFAGCESDLWSLPLFGHRPAVRRSGAAHARHEPQHVSRLLARRTPSRVSPGVPARPSELWLMNMRTTARRARRSGQRRRVLPDVDAGQPSRADGDRPRSGAACVAGGHRHAAGRRRPGAAGSDGQPGACRPTVATSRITSPTRAAA